ncbi:MAG: braG3, partial [Candidatus Eremiobacteraeota bacterium]|nr:braG3 [Candidatus Eremiobacteraeota bacterium]
MRFERSAWQNVILRLSKDEPITVNAMLQLTAVDAYYGSSWILKAVSLAVPAGGVVALLGRNGAGKSTTLKTIAGLVAPRAGSVRFAGTEI